jgi:hypothetical protein
MTLLPDLVELYPVDGTELDPKDVKERCKELAKLSLWRRYHNMWGHMWLHSMGPVALR